MHDRRDLEQEEECKTGGIWNRRRYARQEGSGTGGTSTQDGRDAVHDRYRTGGMQDRKIQERRDSFRTEHSQYLLFIQSI